VRKLALRVLAALSLATLFVLGVDWVLQASEFLESLFTNSPDGWPGLRELESRTVVLGSGCAAMILPVLTAAVWVLAQRDSSIVGRTADGGVIRLSPEAIERLVTRRVRADAPEVVRATSFARQGPGRRPLVTVNVAIGDRTPAPAVEKSVQESALAALRHLFGEAAADSVQVVVYDVVSGRKRGSGPSGRGADAEDAPRRPRRRKASDVPAAGKGAE